MQMDVSDRARRNLNSSEKETDSRKLAVADYNQNLVTGTTNKIANQLTTQIQGSQLRKPDSSTLLGEKIEVIKVYLEGGKQEQQSVEMLTDELSQIQEVRYCLKTLREQMAARHNSNNNKFPANGIRVSVPINKSPVSITSVDGPVSESQEQESVQLREVTKRLYAQLQEMEKRHQEEKETLQAENREFQRRLQEQTERVQCADSEVEGQRQRMEELQRLLGSLELENSALHDKMAASEAELQELRALKEAEKEQKKEKLEKELAVQKEKLHHLDDMLKSQQRKVRHMIEQLQNSRTMIQERDRVICDLEEKVEFLEAENREMRDQVEFCLGNQTPSSRQSEKGAQIVYSKPLTPTSPGNKSLPFIKVIEIKS
ncbi:tuftelin 1b isoform X1 [Colossoma macropomum]|uniref:tuftelin 1b isoform X1 n=2 Tax=Colossoma macropomum TaxID=42526 RepID=UPI001864854D|nr:tuftelin 1b isoform X1 [Colossoma macropomum]